MFVPFSAGATSFVEDDERDRKLVRSCLQEKHDGLGVQKHLIELAQQRLDQMLFVGFTDQHADIAHHVADAFGAIWEGPRGLQSQYDKCIESTHGVKKKQESETVPVRSKHDAPCIVRNTCVCHFLIQSVIMKVHECWYATETGARVCAIRQTAAALDCR